jgi:hypothetical protein
MSASAYEKEGWQDYLGAALGVAGVVKDIASKPAKQKEIAPAPTTQVSAPAKAFEIFGQPWYVAVGVAACLGALAWLLFRK